MMKERNHLQTCLIKANHVIDEYQKWFKKHEHLTKDVHNTLSEISGSAV